MLSAVSQSHELEDPELADPEHSEGAANGEVKGKHLADNIAESSRSKDVR